MLLNVGGGYTNAGIEGYYYPGTSALTGAVLSAPPVGPAFTRSDVRVDFNWGASSLPAGFSGFDNLTTQSGGNNGATVDPRLANFTNDTFQAVSAGDVIPKFSQTYTFSNGDRRGDAVHPAARRRRLDDASGHELLDQPQHRQHARHGHLRHGRRADLQHPVAVRAADGLGGQRQECKLHWSSPSTPDEAIEAAEYIGVNSDPLYDPLYTNMINGSGIDHWWSVPSGVGPGPTPTAGPRLTRGGVGDELLPGRDLQDSVQWHGHCGRER